MCDVEGSGHFFHSKEGMIQGGYLAMIAYRIGILLLIREFLAIHPRVTQPWYADDASAGEKFEAMQEHMWDMMVWGPPQGYLLDPIKIILVVSPRNVLRAEAYFRGMGVCMVTVRRYLVGFIGDPESEKAWLKYKVKGCPKLVEVLAGVVRRHP